MPSPGRKASPHEILRGWVSRGIRHGVRAAGEAFRLTINRLRVPDRDQDVSEDYVRSVGETLSSGTSKLPFGRYADAWRDFLLANQMAGFVNGERVMNRRRSSSKIVTQRDTDIFQVPFERAIQALQERVALPSDVFETLKAVAKSRAGRIARVQNVRIVQSVYEKLLAILRQGGTLRDFRKALETLPEESGWTGATPSHVRLVFQQNATMAFQSGQFAQAADAGAQGYYWRARGSSCPICTPYLDKAFRVGDNRPFPGFAHFGCDCWAEYFFEDEDVEAVSIGSISNPEWQASQGQRGALQGDPSNFANLEPLDLESVPDALRSAFEQFLN